MIPLDNIKNGSQFVVTVAGETDVIHQLPNFTPVVQENATYPNDDHAFYPNGILLDGAPKPVSVATLGLKLKAGMVITVDQLVYHCAKAAADQKAYQCVHGTVIDPGNSAFKAITGYFYLTYADVTRVEPYTAPVQPPKPVTPVDTTVTIIAGSTTYIVAVVRDGQFAEFTTDTRQRVQTEGAGATQYYGLVLMSDEYPDAQEKTISFQCVLATWFHSLPAESAQWPDMGSIPPQTCPALFVDVDVPVGHPDFASVKEGEWYALRFSLNEAMPESLRISTDYLRSEKCDPLSLSLFPQNDVEVQLATITAPDPGTLSRLMTLIS